MAGPIDRLIEDHRRDPDPHPRLSLAIQTQVDDLNARITAIDGGDPEDPIAVPQPAANMPEAVAELAGRPGTSTDYARGDHRHQLELPANLDGLRSLSGTGVMMRAESGAVSATPSPTVDALTITGQAGAGQRMMSAFADGGQVAVDDVRYVPGVDVPASTIIAIAANQSGLSSVRRPAGWATQDVIPGRSLNCATWSGAYWFADCTDGTVHRSIDGITWEILGVTVSAAAKVNALDAVVVVSDFLTGVKVSLDGGDTWQSHTPYGGSPNTHNASCILRLEGGGYRIFDGGQTGTGTSSGIIVSADTNAMPTPGDPWTVRYSGSSAAVFNVSLGPVGVVSATTLPSGNIAVLTSADGLSWEIVDTGISSVSGRSVFYSAIYSAYFIGATNGGSTGSVVTSTDLVTFTETITGLGGPVDSFSEGGGKLYCGANGGGAWEITVSTKAAVASGTIGYVGGDGRPAQAVASDPIVELAGTTGIKVGGQAGTGERVVIAQADGSQRDVDDVQWQEDAGTAYRRLLVTSGINGFVGTNTIAAGTGSGAVAAHQAVGSSGEYAIQAAWCTGNVQTVGGLAAANGIGFVGYGTNTVFYGSHASGSGATVYFAYDVGISARYDLSGWTFRDRIAVTADSGTGERMVVAQADGHHRDVDEVTWDPAALLMTVQRRVAITDTVGGSTGDAFTVTGDQPEPIHLQIRNQNAAGAIDWLLRNNYSDALQTALYGTGYVGNFGGGSIPMAGAAFVGAWGGGVTKVVLGTLGVDAPVMMVANNVEEARFTSVGWTFRQRIQVTADAGTGQRLMSVAADGHHLPIAEATWAGGVLTLNGKLVLPAGTATASPINIGNGVAPTTPVDGDVWLTTTDLLYRVGGITRTAVFNARNIGTPMSVVGGGNLSANLVLTLANDLAAPPTGADYGTNDQRTRGWYKSTEVAPRPAPFSPCVSSFGTFPTGPIAVPALNPAAAFAAYAHGA